MTGRALAPLLAWLLPLGACLKVPAPEASDAGVAGAAGAASDSGAATVEGTDCGQDPYTGTVLCLGVTACPDLVVDQSAFPGCGFRPTGGSVFDLECACWGSLCPIGVAGSCAQARALLVQQTQSLVCAQVSEGRCVEPTTTTPPSTCDQNCRAGCTGDPSCVTFCGC